MQDFDIIFYQTADGACPVANYLKSIQDKKLYAKILRDINLLKVSGNLLHEPYSKSLSHGLFELRTKQGSNISRIIYFFIIGNRIILTNGFIKKTNKTPKEELDKALKYKNDYLNRFSQKEGFDYGKI